MATIPNSSCLAQEVLPSAHLTGVADAGYYNGEQLKQAEDKGIKMFMSIPEKTCAASKENRFTSEQYLAMMHNQITINVLRVSKLRGTASFVNTAVDT
jgi:hypothetical protein